MGFVRKDLLGRNMRRDTPMLLDWKTFANAPQTFQNTPCCWSIYMCGLNLAHMRKIGIPELNRRAKERSSKLYDYIDNSNYYKNGIDKKYRSLMNIPFRVMENEDLEKKFIAESAKENLTDLKGHRSVGGCRASIYNAMPMEGV